MAATTSMNISIMLYRSFALAKTAVAPMHLMFQCPATHAALPTHAEDTTSPATLIEAAAHHPTRRCRHRWITTAGNQGSTCDACAATVYCERKYML